MVYKGKGKGRKTQNTTQNEANYKDGKLSF